jgi:two-component system sensor histidine kinase MprB
MSLRLRLTLFIALVVATAVAAVSWISYTSTADEARKEIDVFLRERGSIGQHFKGLESDIAELLTRFPSVFGERDPFRELARFDTVVQLVDGNGAVTSFIGDVVLPVDDIALETARAGDTMLEDITVDGMHYRMITAPGPDGFVVQTARDVTATDRLLADLRLRLWLIGISGILLAAVGAWFVARRALAPVGRLTDAAEHVAATGDLEAPIPEGGTDEVGRLAAAFNSMFAALATSRRQQRRLVNDAGHELRTPLTSLRTNVEVLTRNQGMDAAQRAEVMSDVSYEIEELSALVTEVVELAGDAGSADQPLVNTDLGDIAGEVVDRASRRSSRQYTVTGSAGVAAVHPARIARAVANLLDNADKWSPAEAPIEVRLEGGQIEVLDRGPGIDPDDLGRVFDRFYRADAARTSPGSGLGLAIVEQIVGEHGGRVWARANEHGGAAVGFEIPLVEV